MKTALPALPPSHGIFRGLWDEMGPFPSETPIFSGLTPAFWITQIMHLIIMACLAAGFCLLNDSWSFLARNAIHNQPLFSCPGSWWPLCGHLPTYIGLQGCLPTGLQSLHQERSPRTFKTSCLSQGHREGWPPLQRSHANLINEGK